jgi:anti-sigma B factor antagonist
MQKLNITIEPMTELENGQLVSFEGDLDGSAEESLKDVQALIDSNGANAKIIFNFSKLNFLNSYAIGHLVEWHNQVSANQGMIAMVGVNKSVEEIFAIVGINNLFTVYADVPTAIEALKSN